MKTAVILRPLLLLGSVWMVQSCLHSPEQLIQDNFDLGQFMGQWYEIAVVSTCPHYMHRKRRSPVIVALDLRHVALEPNFTVTATTLRNGTCKRASTVYSLTELPGKFFHHIPRFTADVYSYVIDTSYDHYTMMLLLSTEQPSGNETTTMKLFSRTAEVRPVLLDKFKTLVRQCKLNDDSIIVNKDVCTESRQTMEPNTQPQSFVPRESKRNVVPPVDSENA